MNLLAYEIRGAQVHINVATSVKKDGSFRLKEAYGIGGNPQGVRGSEKHIKKLNQVSTIFSNATGDDWDIGELVYIDSPRQYYGYITNGEDKLLYMYIATHAPGSGQQYFFSPHLSPTRILNSNFNPELAAWIIKSRFSKDYQKIGFDDQQIMIDLIRQGVTADVVDTALVVMR